MQKDETQIGKVTHYYNHLGVAIIELKENLKIGDIIHITGHATDFTQMVNTIQIEHKDVETAKKGDSVGIKVNENAHEGNQVYKVKSEEGR